MGESPGTMLREARRRARLSQAELARRAGVSQPVISAYESDQREPGVRTFRKLIEATGCALRVELVPPADERAEQPGLRLRRHRAEVLEIAAKYGASNVRVFGSVVRGEDTVDSDIDLLIDHDADFGLFALGGLTQDLTELLGVKVDVVPAEGIKARFRDRIMAEAVPL
jgi:predicted nucleotidyltransferase/DNA-binding XRE family transcriptional regulator